MDCLEGQVGSYTNVRVLPIRGWCPDFDSSAVSIFESQSSVLRAICICGPLSIVRLAVQYLRDGMGQGF